VGEEPFGGILPSGILRSDTNGPPPTAPINKLLAHKSKTRVDDRLNRAQE
jgi:hypothetical protein